MAETVKFRVGATYSTRSLCDWDCVYAFQVVGRTDKTVTITSKAWGVKRRGVRVRDGVETIAPLGRYSMSPTIYASKEGANG